MVSLLPEGEETSRKPSEPSGGLPAFVARSFSGLYTERSIERMIASVSNDPRRRERLARAVTKIAAVWRSFLACRRLERELLRSYQPDAFCLKDGRPAEYGRVAFETGGAHEPARYIRLSDESDIDKVVGLARTAWHMRDAQVVISVTGSAQELKLEPHVCEVLSRGLVRAALQTNAWLVTGGTDTGVMKLVGEAVREYQANVPCIGVTAWGAVHGREQLAGAGSWGEAERSGDVVFMRKAKKSDAAGASLEPNHTHFLLVDTGEEGSRAWCGELDFRGRFERTYCRRSKVPMVLVVVGGSGSKLQAIERAARNRVPIVLIADSGGAPAAIARFLQTDELATDPSGRRGLKPPASASELRRWEASAARIKALHAQHKLITVFSTRQGAAQDSLDLVLLRALLFDTDGDLRQAELTESKKMLHLAIDWGRQEVVAQWMEKAAAAFALPASRLQSGPPTSDPSSPRISPSASCSSLRGAALGAEPAPRRPHEDGSAARRQQLSAELHRALQEGLHIALRTHKAGIVDLLLKSDLRLADVELLELYDETLDHLAIFEGGTQQLRQRLRAHLSHIAHYEQDADVPHSRWGALSARFDSIVSGVRASVVPARPRRAASVASAGGAAPGAGTRGGVAGASLAVFASHRNQQAYEQLIVPLLAKTCKLEGVAELWRTGRVSRWTADDVFYWAVLMSDEALVQVLWRHLDEPIRMALIAAQISKQLAGIARFDSARFANLALKYEGWATGVLSTCDHELEARWLLQQPFNVTVPGRTGGTLITLAIRTQLKGFIAHSHAQSLLDAWWRGDVVEAYDARTGAGGYCLSSSEPHALLVIAHAVTFGLLRLVQMEQTLGAKHAQKSKQHSQFAQVRRGALARLGKSSARDVASIFRQLQQEPTHRPDRLRALVDFYSAPKAKFWLRASSYLCFLLLYALVLILDDGTPDVSRLELAFALWTLGLAVDELHQWQTNRRLHRVHFDGIWNVLDALMFGVLFPATFLVRVAALLTCCDEPWRSLDTDESGLALQGECQCGLAEGARTLLAANAIFCFFRFLANYKVHPRLGVLIHVITVVQGDVGRWFAILLFVVLGFAFAFSGLSPPRRLKLHSDEASPFLIPIWNFFDLQNVSAVTEDSEAPALGMTLLALYLFLSQVLLVNILIAMMNTSYAEATKNAEREWAASRASSVEELLILSPFPPPLSMPFLLYDMLTGGCCASSAVSRPAMQRGTGSFGGGLGEGDAGAAGKERRNVKLMYKYLEECARKSSESVEARMQQLRDEMNRLTSMVESASAERAESRAALDGAMADTARMLRAVHDGLESAGLVPKSGADGGADSSPSADATRTVTLDVPPGRWRPAGSPARVPPISRAASLSPAPAAAAPSEPASPAARADSSEHSPPGQCMLSAVRRLADLSALEKAQATRLRIAAAAANGQRMASSSALLRRARDAEEQRQLPPAEGAGPEASNPFGPSCQY